jgi:hypothetical protein
MESDSNSVHPLYTVKVWRQGSQRVFPLYRAVLAALDFDLDNPNELLIIRVHAPFVSFRVAKPERLIPVENWDPAVLPPAWPAARKSERTP